MVFTIIIAAIGIVCIIGIITCACKKRKIARQKELLQQQREKLIETITQSLENLDKISRMK